MQRSPFEAGVEAETQQGITLADAAKQAGVGHFVFSSVDISGLHRDFPEVEWENYEKWAKQQDWKVISN